MMTNEIKKKKKISLWSQIKEDFSVPKLNDPAFNSNFEIFFNYPGVWAIINHRVAHILYKKVLKNFQRAISGISSFLQNRYSSSCNNWKKSIF